MGDDSGNKASDAMIQSLIREVRENSIALSAFGAELKNLTKLLDSLAKIVRDGNGHSLVTKVSVLETTTSDLKKAIETTVDNRISEIEEKMEDSSKEADKAHRETKNQKMQFYAALIPGVLGLVAAILALIYG